MYADQERHSDLVVIPDSLADKLVPHDSLYLLRIEQQMSMEPGHFQLVGHGDLRFVTSVVDVRGYHRLESLADQYPDGIGDDAIFSGDEVFADRKSLIRYVTAKMQDGIDVAHIYWLRGFEEIDPMQVR